MPEYTLCKRIMQMPKKTMILKNCFVDVSTRGRCPTTIRPMECIALSQSPVW